MNKKVKVLLVILVLAIIVGVAFILLKPTSKQKQEEKKIVSVEKIDGYDYVLEDRDTKLYKEEYLKLKDNLKSDSVDYVEYAKSIASLYVIDLYTIDNKLTKYDVGGVDFVYPDVRDNYELKVQDTLYKYVEDNSYNTRSQDLPVVKSVNVGDTKESTYMIGEKKLNGYEVKLTWDYEKDLGYDTSATISIVNLNKVLYVVEENVTKVE